MATWRVGKTLVGFDKRQQEIAATSERQAKYKLGAIMRQTAATYRNVATAGDPFSWAMILHGLEEMATQLENGGDWPPTIHGMNWLWSLPWGPDDHSDRDLFVFWAKVEGAGGGSGDSEPVTAGTPAGGAKRELASNAA